MSKKLCSIYFFYFLSSFFVWGQPRRVLDDSIVENVQKSIFVLKSTQSSEFGIGFMLEGNMFVTTWSLIKSMGYSVDLDSLYIQNREIQYPVKRVWKALMNRMALFEITADEEIPHIKIGERLSGSEENLFLIVRNHPLAPVTVNEVPLSLVQRDESLQYMDWWQFSFDYEDESVDSVLEIAESITSDRFFRGLPVVNSKGEAVTMISSPYGTAPFLDYSVIQARMGGLHHLLQYSESEKRCLERYPELKGDGGPLGVLNLIDFAELCTQHTPPTKESAGE